MISRSTLIRESRAARGSLPAVLLVYAILFGAMILTGMAIT
jgi:hypothetical protein